MKKFLKITGIILLVLFTAGLIAGFIAHEPLPQGKKGPEAEQLTDKIQQAINQPAWDSTHIVSWSFMGLHDYIWDKQRNLVQIKWADKKVLFSTKTFKGMAYEDGELLDAEETTEAINKAWEYFVNDSFWLAAPFKLRDPGTERSIVELDGEKALKVTYTSGGRTPGDSYVWLLNEDFTPKAWKLWVQIIPIGGIDYGWNEWKTFSTGAHLATEHHGIINLKNRNIKLSDSFKGKDPFGYMDF